MEIISSIRNKSKLQPIFLGMDNLSVNLSKLFKIQKQLQHGRKWSRLKGMLLTNALKEVQIYPQALVHLLLEIISYKDPELAAHCLRVMHYSKKIGINLGITPREVEIIEIGAKIHDLGKVATPDPILYKPGPLTPFELEIMKKHPRDGYDIIKDIPVLADYLPIVLWHHEKLDGSGYPDHLTESQIPFLVKIVTVADIYDAMTSNRVYRPRLPLEKALEILGKEASQGLLDQFIVDTFIEIIKQEQKTITEGVFYQAA